MKKTLLLSFAVVSMLAANAGGSPYIARVYDFLPAPGQFVNTMPAYKPGYTQDSINALVEAALCGRANGGTVSLTASAGTSFSALTTLWSTSTTMT